MEVECYDKTYLRLELVAPGFSPRSGGAVLVQAYGGRQLKFHIRYKLTHRVLGWPSCTKPKRLRRSTIREAQSDSDRDEAFLRHGMLDEGFGQLPKSMRTVWSTPKLLRSMSDWVNTGLLSPISTGDTCFWPWSRGTCMPGPDGMLANGAWVDAQSGSTDGACTSTVVGPRLEKLEWFNIPEPTNHLLIRI